MNPRKTIGAMIVIHSCDCTKPRASGLRIESNGAESGSGASQSSALASTRLGSISQRTGLRQRGEGNRPSGKSSATNTIPMMIWPPSQLAFATIAAACDQGSPCGRTKIPYTAYSCTSVRRAVATPMPSRIQPIGFCGRRDATIAPTSGYARVAQPARSCGPEQVDALMPRRERQHARDRQQHAAEGDDRQREAPGRHEPLSSGRLARTR